MYRYRRNVYCGVYWYGAETVERDDRGAPRGGARRDPGYHGGTGHRERAAVGNDVADRGEDWHRTCDVIQVLPRRRGDPARLARTSRQWPPGTSRRTTGPGWRRSSAARSRARGLRTHSAQAPPHRTRGTPASR